MVTDLVKSYLAAGLSGKAVDLLTARIDANGQDVMACNLLGEVYLTQKQFEAAAKVFQKAIAINPEWQTPHNNLARVYLSQGKKEEAIENLTAALEKNPKNAAAYMTLGVPLPQRRAGRQSGRYLRKSPGCTA